MYSIHVMKPFAYVVSPIIHPSVSPFFFSLFSVHYGQRRHLLAAHKIIHGEVEKLISENKTSDSEDIPTKEDDTASVDKADSS